MGGSHRLTLALLVVGSCLAAQQERSPTPLNIVHRLHALIKHYAKHPQGINVDGLYGLRITQGALQATLNNLRSSTEENTQLSVALMNVTSMIDAVCTKSQANLERTDTTYFQSFKPLVDSPFPTSGITKKLPKSSKPRHSVSYKIHRYNETQGDICYKKLMGTFKDQLQNKYSQKCEVDKECIALMTKSGQQRYVLTHQLLYFIIAQKIGCKDVMDRALQPMKLNLMERQLCGEILAENDSTFQPRVPHLERHNLDIFIEQGVLCMMQGYTDIINGRKLRAVMSYQNIEKGCYGPWRSRTRYGSHVSKRRERTDEDQCMAHTTGLAAAYMALSLYHGIV